MSSAVVRRVGRIGTTTILAAAVASVFVFLYAPLIVTGLFSFNEASVQVLPLRGLTLRWYRALFDDPEMVAAILYSLRVALAATVVCAVAGVYFALVLHRKMFLGKNVFQALLVTPLVTPGVVLGISLLVVFRVLSVAPGYWTIVIGHAVFISPLTTFIVLQRLRTMDPTLEHASMDCGAGPVRTFWHVTLPGIRVALIAGSLLGFTLSMDEITLTYFLAGTDETLPVHVWTLTKLGFTPEVNAAFTIISGGSLVLILTATTLLAGSGLRGLQPGLATGKAT